MRSILNHVLTKKEKIFLVIVVLACLGSIWFFGIYRPIRQRIQAADTTEKKDEAFTTPKIESAKSRNTQLSGTYTVTASGLHIRSGSSLNKSSLGILSRGSFVRCYGYYTEVNGVKWLYVTGNGLTGFCCSKYLKKL